MIMAYRNMTSDEMIREAEATNNELALAISTTLEDEIREQVEEEFDETTRVEDGMICSKMEIADNVKYLLTEAVWEKHDTASEWYVEEFNRDTNIKNNHIGVRGLGGSLYEVFVEAGPYGEDVNEKRVSGLKSAKNAAIDLAIEAAGNQLLMR